MTTTNEISVRELETVSGGTVTEFEQLYKAYYSNGFLVALAGGIGTHIPGVNYIAVAGLEKHLEENLKIKADISIGFAGTGIGSDPNTYVDMETGKSLTHAEVLERIKTFRP